VPVLPAHGTILAVTFGGTDANVDEGTNSKSRRAITALSPPRVLCCN